MEQQKHICASVCDGLPTLSTNHPWLVDENLEAMEEDSRDHILYTICDPPSQHRCRIPSSLGRCIRGCFYGWVILSNHPDNDLWSLWYPLTSKVIRLPPLISKKGALQKCCLSSPPDDHGSVFMLTTKQYTIVFCRLDCKRKRLKWVEMSYAKQMRRITGGYDAHLCSLTCWNGRVYALDTFYSVHFVTHINVVVKGRETVISLLPYLELPSCYMNGCPHHTYLLKGCGTELFFIGVGLNKTGHVTKKTIGAVCVFKLNMTDRSWEEMEDLKDVAFFLDFAHGYTVFDSPAIGGQVHILDRSGKVIHSYDFKNRTIALSSMPTTHTSLSNRRLQVDHGKIKCGSESQLEEGRGNEMVVRDDSSNTRIETRLLDIPFDVLKTIMGFCVGVEYLNFRATCKQCHLAAPMVRWSKGGRLQAYSLVSPWLMVLDDVRGVMSFTDPVFGDKYFIKTPRELIGDMEIHSSMFGWLLIRKLRGPLMFFNPFTNDIRALPYTPYLDSYCFSAPPTSSDCMVVGFMTYGEWNVFVHFVSREPFWRRFRLNSCDNDDAHYFHFATIYRQNLYALYNNEGLDFVYEDNQDYTWRKVIAEGPRSRCGSGRQNFLIKCDQQLLLVIVSELGECVEVFKLIDSTEWEKTESLGRHAIYISGLACLCIEAKTPEMANKIYFPRLHSGSGKIVFYSLETRRYHTFNGQDIEESFQDFIGTKHHVDSRVWIEPSWS